MEYRLIGTSNFNHNHMAFMAIEYSTICIYDNSYIDQIAYEVYLFVASTWHDMSHSVEHCSLWSNYKQTQGTFLLQQKYQPILRTGNEYEKWKELHSQRLTQCAVSPTVQWQKKTRRNRGKKTHTHCYKINIQTHMQHIQTRGNTIYMLAWMAQ